MKSASTTGGQSCLTSVCNGFYCETGVFTLDFQIQELKEELKVRMMFRMSTPMVNV